MTVAQSRDDDTPPPPTRVVAADAARSPAAASGGPFVALRSPNYRLLWMSMFGTSATLWMEAVAYGWLILELTNSPFLLGLVGFARAIPNVVFALWGGALADRLDRKRVLTICQAVMVTTAVAVAALTTVGWIAVWHVFVASVVAGIAQSFNLPARQSIIGDSVAKQHLGNAIALNSLAFNVSRVIGPAIAGVLVATVGTAGVFWLQSAALLGVMVATFALRLPPRPYEAPKQSTWHDITDGVVFVRNDPLVRGLMALLAIPVVLAWPYQTLLPVFARDVLGAGPDGLGVLMSAAGVGAIIAVSTLVFAGDFRHRALAQYLLAFLFGLGLVVFALSTTLIGSVALIALLAGSSIAYNVMNQTAVQQYTPNAVRGRVLGIYQLVMGLMPVGSLIAGAAADAIGAQLTVLIMGLLTMLAIPLIVWTNPALRRLDFPTTPRADN
ncbi:MAG: MFS transporter [Dehalococcoidia bacterium]|nr:MFS transporter [Dehalococcoidia bacterium]